MESALDSESALTTTQPTVQRVQVTWPQPESVAMLLNVRQGDSWDHWTEAVSPMCLSAHLG